MRIGYHLLVITICCFGCTQYSSEQTESFKSPFVKSNCDNKALYLDLLQARYSFPVMCVSSNYDTIDLNENVLIRHFTIAPLEPDTSVGDSILKPGGDSFWQQRAFWNHVDARYSSLDSFSLLLDTSYEVCSSFFTIDISGEGSTRQEFTRFYPLLVRNLSSDTTTILEYSGAQLEILNKKNEWEPVLRDDIMCLTGVVNYWIAPKETIVILIPVTEGKYTRTMRVKFQDNYSTSFQANCNYKY